MEAAWHEKNADLKARVFLSAGEAEAGPIRSGPGRRSSPPWRPWRSASPCAAIPRWNWTVRIFPDEDHLTVMPIAYTRGIRVLWGE